MRRNKREALGDALWDLGLVLSVVLLSAGAALKVARVAAPAQTIGPSLPVTLDSCPPRERRPEPLFLGPPPGPSWLPAYTWPEVEEPALLLRGDVPSRMTDTTRRVLAQFVIDTMGRAIEGSLEVLKVYNPRRQQLWTLPAVVRGLRYQPAEQPAAARCVSWSGRRSSSGCGRGAAV